MSNFVPTKSTKKSVETAPLDDRDPTRQSLKVLPLLHNSTGVCDQDHNNDYRGILHISRVFKKAATGTFFFQAIVDAILFAQQHNLYPLIWIDKMSDKQPCYDVRWHGKDAVGNTTFTHPRGDIINIPQTSINYKLSDGCAHEPHHPDFENVENDTFSLKGNGIWQLYFQATPVPFGLPCFKDKPVFELEQPQILPGIHYCASWAVRGWTYPRLVKTAFPRYHNLTTREWLHQHRQRATQIVQQYFRPQPWLQQKIDRAFHPPAGGQCLSVHIRLTDKGSGREKQGVGVYLPYIEAYVRALNNAMEDESIRNPTIFLATDDATTLSKLVNRSSILTDPMFHTQPNVLLSTGSTATFSAFKDQRHRLNTETLVDIYSLSKCQYLIHGYSAVPEAAIYLNPSLHFNSVNIDDVDGVISPDKFQQMVETMMKEER